MQRTYFAIYRTLTGLIESDAGGQLCVYDHEATADLVCREMNLQFGYNEYVVKPLIL